MDDKQHATPTKQNILDAFTNLVQSCQAGDVVFCHFAGTYRLQSASQSDSCAVLFRTVSRKSTYSRVTASIFFLNFRSWIQS